ncbi:MarR family winged helix-turn-helix transcriptional regulator [Skermania piniformis]|uniref:MarR family transcriptional regulator n=1 Tax=Skermania pinensis TaxID=39122 RepID=A0ABX8SCK7_9ACTN|nr:MarR family transcriptional regulator [Skermania piniformis]QXQ15593.1 MarR family transcriptional regulator [Skermania piniformis]
MVGQQRLLDQLNRQLQRDADLTLAEYRILVLLSESPGQSLRMSDLADGVLSSRSRLTHQIRRMEDQGLVRRESCAEDGRGVLAHLTERGLTKLKDSAPGHVASVRQHFFDLVDEQEIGVLAEVFSRIVDDQDDAADG